MEEVQQVVLTFNRGLIDPLYLFHGDGHKKIFSPSVDNNRILIVEKGGGGLQLYHLPSPAPSHFTQVSDIKINEILFTLLLLFEKAVLLLNLPILSL